MRKFNPANMERLLSPERSQWQNPDTILDNIGLTTLMSFADIGAGPGFFALPAARKVGLEGKVFALDIEPTMLIRLVERATTEGITNLEALVSLEDRLPLDDETVDIALLATVLHECWDHVGFLHEIARVLRPKGALAVIEWRKDSLEKGPPPEERMAREYVESVLWAAGYQSIEPFEVGPYHYGIRVRKGSTMLQVDAGTSIVRGAYHYEHAIEPYIRD